MTTQKLLTIGLIALVITVLLAVGGALFKGQDTILSTSSVPSSTIEASAGGYEIINGTSVPPEPDPAVNNATLAGVDSNANGVRDDVERVIADKFGKSTDYTYAIAYAKEYQQMVVSPRPAQRSDALAEVKKQLCAAEGGSKTLYNFGLGEVIANTDVRRQVVREFNDVLGGYTRQEIGLCAQLIQTETINGISVPPEPDPVVNNSTLAGVDMNQNGVRDDVERVLARKAPSVDDFNDLIRYFAAYQHIATDPTPNNREAAVAQYRVINCSLGKGVPITHLANLMRQNEIDTLALVFNTSERIAKRTATGKMLDGGYDGEELLCE